MLLTKEHYELMASFEAEHKHCRLDREDKSHWAKGYVYGDGHVNNLFLAYRKGYALGAALASPAPQELPPVQLPEPAFRAINCAEGYDHGPIWVVVPPQAKPGPLTEHDCYTADQLRAAIAADRRAGGR